MVSTALRLAGIKGSETPLKTSELSDGMDSLNRMGAQLEQEGFELDFTTLTTGSDPVTVPAYAEDFYTYQLAARLAPEYATELSALTLEAIKSGRRVVVRALNSKAVGQTGTYQNIIFGAIEMLNVKAAAEPITTTELQNAMPALNDVMLSIESKSINIGYQINSTTVLTGSHGLPDWSWGWIKAELAIAISSSYGVPPNDITIRAQKDGLANAYMRLYDAPTVNLPSTLPTGDAYGSFYGNPTKDALLTGSNDFLLDDENNIVLGE
jgi:hypothetical protein